MMWVGTEAAGVCLESIQDPEVRKHHAKNYDILFFNFCVKSQERRAVESALRSVPGRRLLDLTQAEVEHFAGNCLEVRSVRKGDGGGGYKRHLVRHFPFPN